MKTQIYLLPLAVVSSALVAVTGFQAQVLLPSSSLLSSSSPIQPPTANARTTTTTFLEARSNKKKVVEERPSNEFSRTVPPEKVLKMQGKHMMRSGANRMPDRQYSFEIDASEEECQGLARRFDLPEIDSLEAALSLSPESNSAVDSQSRGILVQGTVQAHITRTCVRTNQPFPVEMEFPIYALVRPVPQSGSGGPSPAALLADGDTNDKGVELNRDITTNNGKKKKKNKKDFDQSDYYGQDDDEEEEEVVDPDDLLKIQAMLEGKSSNNKKKNKKGSDDSSYYGEEDEEDAIDPEELLKMQTMLEGLENKDEDVDDILMEDEYIYATTGALDVGELVSQLFWLELDPYPRKPGSEFKQFSISG